MAENGLLFPAAQPRLAVMSLLVPMYHRARAGPHGNDPDRLDRHFAHIARHARCVLPGDWLKPGALNVCLTFDDATFDFYAVVFPLLKKHGLRALLAVPTAVVRERTDVPAEARLAAAADVNDPQRDDGGFCTWPELREMADTKLVAIAGHGATHVRLDRDGVDLETEIVGAQTLLAARLGRSVTSFVFPFGRFSAAALQKVRQTYRYAFRIGGADNASWGDRVLYRVDGDNLRSPDALFTPPRRAGYRLRRYWNLARGR
jgi:peptidoglycan/xylan/chitin deacetylase (PgdA/CDA1 family)